MSTASTTASSRSPSSPNAASSAELERQAQQMRQLFELAEDNQLAVQDAIACLGAEREAMVKERRALVQSATNSAEVSDTLRRATAQAVPAVEAAAERAVKAAMDQALASQAQAHEALRRDMSESVPAIERAAERVIRESMERALGLTQDAATRIWSGTAAPVVERFTTVAQLASDMEARVRRAGHRHAWQWAALTALGVVATVVVAVVGVQQLHAQQAEVQRQQTELAAQRAAFAEEMARMQASVTFLEKKGGRIHLDKCGPEQRLCIEVAPDQGSGRGTFRGVWADAQNTRTFVIPKGY